MAEGLIMADYLYELYAMDIIINVMQLTLMRFWGRIHININGANYVKISHIILDSCYSNMTCIFIILYHQIDHTRKLMNIH